MTLNTQLQHAPDDVKGYLREQLGKVINHDDFEEGLYAHLAGGYGGIDASYIRAKLENALGI